MRVATGLAVLALTLPALPAAAQTAGQTPGKPAVEPPVVYRVKSGDTLVGLGGRYLVKTSDYRAVQRLNRVRDPRRLPTGASLTIPAPLLKSEPIPAALAAFSGRVTITRAGQPLAAARDLALVEGDRIATGPNAFATVALPDESRVSLPSNSTLVIVRLRQILLTGGLKRTFDIQLGKGAAQVTPLPTPDSQFLIRTPLSVAAVRGTEYRVAYDPDRARAQAEVIKGVVGVAPAAGQAPVETPVPAGFGARAVAEGVSAPKALLPAPALVRGGRTQEDPQVTFQVEPVAGAGRYHLQLANDAGFVDVFAEVETVAPSAVFEGVPDGVYFVRATAIDADGLEGVPKDYGFERDLNVLDAAQPQAETAGKMKKFKFRWSSAGAGTRVFQLQVFRGDAAVPYADLPGLTEPEVSLTDLPPGAYRWRVIATRFKPGQPPSVKVGSFQDLQIGQ